MAISQPEVKVINAFDATKDYTVQFTVSADSDQVIQNTLIITTNSEDTPEIVYQQTVRSFNLEHTIPANTLINGNQYTASVIAIGTGSTSPASDPRLFSCYSDGKIVFMNITNNDVVGTSNCTFEFRYTQDQNRPLVNYNVSLYNASYVKVQESGNQYTNSINVPYESSYQVSGLLNNTTYVVQIEGNTQDGMSVLSEYITFTVIYGQTGLHTQLMLSNNCQEGYVVVQSGIIPINGVTLWPPTYIDDAAIDLTDGNIVTWGQGYRISGDFTVSAWGRKFIPGKIVSLYNELGQEIRIEFHGTYASLHVTPGYVIFSNELDSEPAETDQVFIWARRYANLYEIRIENKGAASS